MIEKIKDLISDYSIEEFGYEPDYSDLHHIGLAYTQDDKHHDVQAEADLIDLALRYYNGGKLIKEEKFETPEQMYQHLSGFWTLTFGELIAKCNPYFI